MGAFLYNGAMAVTETQVRQKNQFLLHQVSEVFNTVSSNTNRLISYLSVKAATIKLSHDSSSSGSKNFFRDLHNINSSLEFAAPDIYDDYILDYFVLTESPKTIMNYNLALPLETYLKYNLGLDKDDMNNVYSAFYDTPYTRYAFKEIISLMENEISPPLAFLQKFGGSYSTRGVIVVYINSEKLLSLLKNIDITDGGGVFVLDMEGRILLSRTTGIYFDKILRNGIFGASQLESIRNSNSWIITEVSKQTIYPLTFMTIQSSDYLNLQTEKIKKYFTTVMAIIITIGIGISLTIVYMNSKPLYKIFSLFHYKETDKEFSVTKNMTNPLWGLFKNLSYYFQNMTGHLEQQKKLIQSTVLEKLLKGYYISPEEHEQIIDYCIKKYASFFTIILIKLYKNDNAVDFSASNNFLIRKSQLKVLLELYPANSQVYLHDQNPSTIVLIHQSFHINEERVRSDIRTYVESLHWKICEDTHLKNSISIGNSVTSTDKLYRSYEQASMTLSYQKSSRNGEILWYDKNFEQTMPLYLPLDVESKLYNSVFAGDEEGVEVILSELHYKNFQEKCITFSRIKTFFGIIIGLLVNINQRLQMEDTEIQIATEEILDEEITPLSYSSQFVKIRELFLRICRKNTVQSDNRQKLLATEIKDYINKTFRNPLISATSVGNQFQISENYLFKLFKMYNGTSFHQYLESKRMNYIIEHMTSSQESIKTIVTSSGYSSLNTFYKAFKKLHGVSAGQYRQQQKKYPPEK